MGSSPTLLSLLRDKTTVDCDTLDATVAESLGPFEDCTSNQAIAYFELLHTHHKDLMIESAASAKDLHPRYSGVKLEALAVEICMINLGLQILPHLRGRIHIQANPFDAYSTNRTIAAARRIIELFEHLSSGLSAKDRVCVKIPSTWEGLQACRVLEKEHGITTLATTLFSLEQAAVAAEAGCRYIAPYVNELAVHFEKGTFLLPISCDHAHIAKFTDNDLTRSCSFVDPSPNHYVCVQSQLYFEKHGYDRTATLPASLVSISECMSLAGVKHITIAPALLRALNTTTTTSGTPSTGPNHKSLFEDKTYLDKIAGTIPAQPLNLIDDEGRFRMMFTRRDGGSQEIKQVKAINVFADMQTKLEEIVRSHLQ